MEAVRKYDLTMEFGTQTFQRKREVRDEAVNQNGLASEFQSEE